MMMMTNSFITPNYELKHILDLEGIMFRSMTAALLVAGETVHGLADETCNRDHEVDTVI